MLQIYSLCPLKETLEANKQQTDNKAAYAKLFEITGSAEHCDAIEDLA